MLAIPCRNFGFGPTRLHITSGTNAPSETSWIATFQLGAGIAYAINPNVNSLGEVRWNIYTKSGYGSTVAVPTVGLEIH